ncbi:hypothetical protein [Fervidibacillus halotolerans]|uniref:DUF4352 domain-containing protein n=1 Tax=Fervidibacillus halotolerans TaxID=2980027 RepID=A0A9E8RZS9_9BACI|nr:hypothetical protein [Fervidibacillus halotolerans]WAA13469.1 hypothetical protein OE105_04985 [Fervidibacillus halotolerans]
MKKIGLIGFVAFLLLFLSVGCQSTKSADQMDEPTNKVEEKSTTEKETAKDENEQVEEKEQKAENEEEVKEDESVVEKEGTEEKQQEQEQTLNLEEETVDGITLKITEIQEYIPETIQASKDRFISIKMEITNEREETVELSSLRHFSLLVVDQPQDLAYIEGVSELATEVPAGKTVTKQIVYDCVNTDEYQFIFQLTEDHPVSWTFSVDKKG